MNACIAQHGDETDAATSSLESCLKMCYASKRRGSFINILSHVLSRGTNYDDYSDREYNLVDID